MKQTIVEYANGFNLIQQALNGLTEDQLNLREKVNGWSIKEIVIHLCDAEIVLTHRLKQVISEENPIMIGFDQDLWAKRQNYDLLDVTPHLEMLRYNRLSMVPILNSLAEEDWNRTGEHNQAGTLSLRDLAFKIVSHTQAHINQIERVKAANK
ncbi:MAG: hypothetical protein JWM44_1151 [Bacilli bacterium]|nr:hypothetical protein [Bacilli bacterium]